jgi:hypothetical protein
VAPNTVCATVSGNGAASNPLNAPTLLSPLGPLLAQRHRRNELQRISVWPDAARHPKNLKQEHERERRRLMVIAANLAPAKLALVTTWLDRTDQGLSTLLGSLTDPDDADATAQRSAKRARLASVCTAVPTFAQCVAQMGKARMVRSVSAAAWSSASARSSTVVSDAMGSSDDVLQTVSAVTVVTVRSER